MTINRSEVLNHNHPPNGLKSQIMNALIVGGFNLFGTLAGLGAVGIITDPIQGLIAGGISFGVSFFGSLMVQRGITMKSK